jgi:peptide-methionine (S)-S-oxide reductase
VGYAGGTAQNPTYRNLGGHSETVQIDYDPSKITYEELLDVFWSGHDPSYRSWSRQYASIIFVRNEEQRRLAEESKARIEARQGRSAATLVLPYTGFTMAEDYHQKHSLRQFPKFMEELRRIYPAPADFTASTSVARLNGYLGGEGSYELLLREKDALGLSPERKEELLKLVRHHLGIPVCPVPE